MKTLDYRTSKTIESTRLQMEDGCNGVKQVIFFFVEQTHNVYTDGTSEVWRTSYVKQDGREFVKQSEVSRYYDTEKSYRNAIKRWSRKAIAQIMKDWKDILYDKIKDNDNYNTFTEM